MGSTQREEMVPAPPPYAATIEPSTFAPPPGPPPPLDNDGVEAANGAPLVPPPLVQAPPTYEPFSFADEYVTHVQRDKGPFSSAPPRWHAAPVYSVYHDANASSLTFHLSLPSTLPPCACGSDFHCQCGRRRPALWHANKRGLGTRHKLELLRLSPFSGRSERALIASKGAMPGSSTMTIRDDRDSKVCELAQSNYRRTFKFLDGRTLTWIKHSRRLELLNEAQQPMAILHTDVVPARLELTAFPWARMPSDELECDHEGCTLRPLYGFVFRCRTCTEEGDDSFDVCEPHLLEECAKHNPEHRFERQARPFGEYDDLVHETPLLRMKDMEAQRRSQELVIITLACMLLEKEKR